MSHIERRVTISLPSNPSSIDVTVQYHALNGQIFTKSGVKWFEMSEAFSCLSREAYENDTSVDFVVVS